MVIFYRVFIFFIIITVLYFDLQVFFTVFFGLNNSNADMAVYSAAISMIVSIAMLLTLFFFLRLENETLKNIGLEYGEKTPVLFGLGVLIAVIGLFFSVIIEIISGVARVVTPPSLDPISLILTLSLFLFISFIGAAFIEELLFRGYIQSHLQKVTSFPVALVLTSILFGILHLVLFLPSRYYWGLTAFVTSFLGGLVFGFAYEVTNKNLAFPIALHGAWNATIYIIWIDFRYFTFVQFIMEVIATIIGLGIICLFIFGLIYLTKFFQHSNLINFGYKNK